jgi:hypothetical protein
MSKEKIQMICAFVASAVVVSVLISSVQTTSAHGNQSEVNETAQIEGMIDDLLLAQPVLSELMDEEDSGVIQYLNELDTEEAVHTLLGLNALQALVELQSSAAGVGNQTVVMANETGTNQTGL